MKKIISIIMVVALAISTIGITAFAESETISTEGYYYFGEESFKWDYNKKTKTLTAYKPTQEEMKANGETQNKDYKYLDIEYLDLRGISQFHCLAFREISAKDVLLNENVKEIKGSFGAFNRCLSMEFINLQHLNTIYPEMFLDCQSLGRIYVGTIDISNATFIGKDAFTACMSLKRIKFSKKLKTIQARAFSDTGFETISLPNSVTSTLDSTFEYCNNLKSIKIGNKVKRLEGTFEHCPKLESVTLGKSVNSIVVGTFSYCKSLKKITLKNTKKAPKFDDSEFSDAKSGIKFYVKNKTVAKSLKKNLKNSGVKNGKIYIGKKLIYKNVK